MELMVHVIKDQIVAQQVDPQDHQLENLDRLDAVRENVVGDVEIIKINGLVNMIVKVVKDVKNHIILRNHVKPVIKRAPL
jgi:hypothetical protein